MLASAFWRSGCSPSEYDLFHLFDYLALGAGVAAYLIIEPSKNEALRSHRFEILRWGLAIALMW